MASKISEKQAASLLNSLLATHASRVAGGKKRWAGKSAKERAAIMSANRLKGLTPEQLAAKQARELTKKKRKPSAAVKD